MNGIKKIIRVVMKWPPALVTILVVALIAYATLVPKPLGDNDIQLFPGFDKLVHFIMFAVLSMALAFDYGRSKGDYAKIKISRSALAVMAFLSALTGGAVEVAQGAMDAGRSADWYDFVADSLGAVAGVAVFAFAVRRLGLDEKYGRIRLVEAGASLPEEVKCIYMASFPPEEQRPWESIETLQADESSPFHVSLILFEGKVAGFISWWRFDRFVYVEHFAVDGSMRNYGIGSKAIDLFVDFMDRCPVVLEVEPVDTSAEAERRVQFYERHGFVAHHGYEYVQPPYSPGLPSVKLVLMSNPEAVDLERAAATMHRHVYGVTD